MDRIPNLPDKHIGQPLHHTLSLESITIHPGVWFRDDEATPSQLLEKQRKSFRTQGFDIMITLTRLLKARGYSADSNRPLTNIEEAILEVADKASSRDE
jgi:hypothetical protein